jgi:hypothetical protein
MGAIVDFAGVAGAIGVSVALAVWIEWVVLRGLLQLMPARAAVAIKAAETAERNYQPARKAA